MDEMVDDFHRPHTIDEAVGLKARLQHQARFIAGGTVLGSAECGDHPPHLISLAALGLDRIEPEGQTLRMGACCTLQELADAALVPPILRQACRHLSNRNIRNMATLGGNIAANWTYSALIPALAVLEAQLEVALAGGGTKRVPVLDYAALSDSGLITAVRIPLHSVDRRAAIGRHVRCANDRPAVTSAVSLGLDDGRLRAPIIAVGGVAPRVVRLEQAERWLDGKTLPVAEEIERKVQAEVEPVSDLRGSARLKRYLAGVLVATNLQEAASGKEGTSW